MHGSRNRTNPLARMTDPHSGGTTDAEHRIIRVHSAGECRLCIRSRSRAKALLLA
jgi:hypothetical protein